MKNYNALNRFSIIRKGQSLVEYILVVFLVSFWVLKIAQAFGLVLDGAFVLAIYNIAYSCK